MAGRIASLDVFRGIVVLTMIIVNVLGHFTATPWLLKHHPYGISVADAVMPLFLFIVGIGMRLSYVRRAKQAPGESPVPGLCARYAKLLTVGCFAYFMFQVFRSDFSLLRFVSDWMWDALVVIALAGMIAIPLMRAGPGERIVAAVVLVIGYQLIFDFTPYGKWAVESSMNGGPIGIMGWTAVLLLGSVATDFLRDTPKDTVFASLGLGVLLVFAGLDLDYEGALMSKRHISESMVAVASGIGFLAFAGFHALFDRWNTRLPLLPFYGRTALILYLASGFFQALGQAFLPALYSKGAPMETAILALLSVLLLSTLVAWFCDKKGWRIPL